MHYYIPSLHAIKSLPDISFWIIVLSIGIFSCYFFYQSYKHLLKSRTLEDFPTAKIRSAAQGYTQLKGTQQNINQIPTIAPLSQLPCTWYRYKIEYYSNRGWQLVEHGESQQLFELDDGTGQCVIDPKGAQVETPIHDSWLGFKRHPNGKPNNILFKLLSSFGRFRYQELRMQAGMPLLAIGNFRTYRMSDNNSYQETFKALYGITPATINLFYGDSKSARTPFILSAIDRKKELRNNKIAAFIWFVAYIGIISIVASLIIARF